LALLIGGVEEGVVVASAATIELVVVLKMELEE
jgi:hypothetical protein